MKNNETPHPASIDPVDTHPLNCKRHLMDSRDKTTRHVSDKQQPEWPLGTEKVSRIISFRRHPFKKQKSCIKWIQFYFILFCSLLSQRIHVWKVSNLTPRSVGHIHSDEYLLTISDPSGHSISITSVFINLLLIASVITMECYILEWPEVVALDWRACVSVQFWNEEREQVRKSLAPTRK